MKHRSKIALVVVLIATTSMALAHLVAAYVNPAASPVVILGTLVIGFTPTPLKEFAISAFGSNDKIVLVGSILFVVTLATAAMGARWAHKRSELKIMVMMLAGLPFLLSFLVTKATFTTLLPSLVLMIVAYGLLKLFLDGWNLVPYSKWDELDGKRATADPVGRRTLIVGLGALALATSFAGVAGQRLIQAKNSIGDVVLPKAAKRLPKKVSGIEGRIPGLTPLVTSNRDFYRVDVNLTVPVVDQKTWQLEIKRDGFPTKRYSYDDILKMKFVERDITLACVSNTVGGEYVGGARWAGVDLMPLLDDFNPTDGKVNQLLSTSVDGYTASSPLKYVTDGRDSMLALGMNGETLPRAHGFPARLLIPGLFGFIGATKWITTIELTTYSKAEAYWTKRDWATDAPIKPQARIDVPASFEKVKGAGGVVAGVAWAGVRGVSAVQVALDDGPWLEATIDVPKGGSPEAGRVGVLANDTDYWVQWYLDTESLPPGRHRVSARCVTKDGQVQTESRADSFPEGATGWDSREFMVV